MTTLSPAGEAIAEGIVVVARDAEAVAMRARLMRDDRFMKIKDLYWRTAEQD